MKVLRVQKKVNVVSIFLALACGVGATLPYRRSGEMDWCRITLLSPSGVDKQLSLFSHSASSAGVDSKDGPDINGTAIYNFWSVAEGSNRALLFDYRPYTTYYIDYPLGMSLQEPGKYTFSYDWNIGRNPAATVLYLYDNKKSGTSPVANLMGGDIYEFDIKDSEIPSSGGTLVITGRFRVRMYGSHLSTENYEGAWRDIHSWQGGTLPDSNSHVIVNPTSLIHIANGDQLEIGYLSNYGCLENNGTLTIREGAEIVP